MSKRARGKGFGGTCSWARSSVRCARMKLGLVTRRGPSAPPAKFGFLERWAWAGAIAASLAVGCSPKIGDKCSVSTDCSVQGDRLCDPTQPGGYCTVFNCEPDRCPDESVCV